MVFVWHLYGPHWLLQVGWHRKTWAVSLTVGWIGLNKNTPIFNLNSSLSPDMSALMSQHWWK